MKLVFDQSFDGGAYPGPLADCTATMGELWVGPLGLLDILETRLGLGGPTFTSAERAVDRIHVLASHEGFWSKSFEMDPITTAEVLLRWRDHLVMWGWKRKCDAPRLADLWDVTIDVLPGVPDRLCRVSDALQSRGPDIESIGRVMPVDDLPSLWQQVFRQLMQHAVDVTDITLPAVAAKGNLGAASLPAFQPITGDDSLILLSPMGVMEAAECVAAHLAGLPDPASTVLVNPDQALDRALARYGLPTSGASGDLGGCGLLQVLPLVLACAWEPVDPAAILQLLTLYPGPVPGRLASDLANAMHEWPSCRSSVWNSTLSTGLENIEDSEYRARVVERLSRIFTANAVVGEPCAVDAVLDRVDCVREWMASRVHAGGDAPGALPPATWTAGITQCRQFRRLVELSQQPAFSSSEISRLMKGANNAVPPPQGRPAEAGFSRVDDPGGVAGPADRVIWWDFTREAVPALPKVPLSKHEKLALRDTGCVLPNPGDLAIAAAQRWQRPLRQSRQSLVLVCPQGGADAHLTGTHPLWDEIIGNLSAPSESISATIRQNLGNLAGAVRVERAPLALLSAKRTWQVSAAIPPRDSESPSGAGTLVGCSLKWVLNYACRLRAGTTADLPGDSLLWGNIVHDLVARVLKEETGSPEEARARAEQLFESLIPEMSSSLCLPGGEADRAQVKRAVAQTAESLRRMMVDSNAPLVSAEESYEMPWLGAMLNGTPDLIVDAPRRVVDIKWSGHGFRKESLKNGIAYQLAAYSHLAREPGATPLPGAYYICREGRFLTTDSSAFQNANALPGPGPAETWEAFGNAYAARMQEMAQGSATATGVEDENGNGPPKNEQILDGRTVLKPPCQFCEYHGLCGKARGE
ncbi:MAG: ATP-dependent helicase/nuclease subunit B [Kiritimatiellia bacterium]|jgi:ATP-dependent helicase/nuclease subunit B